MIALPNNCRMSEIAVFPKNWKTGGKKSLDESWYIKYRFYDDNAGKQKQIVVSGFTKYKDLAERRAAVELRIAKNLREHKELGYNPITDTSTKPIDKDLKKGEVTKYSPFMEALRFGDSRLKVSEDTRKRENNWVMRGVAASAIKNGYDQLSIGEINQRHIKTILEDCAIKENKEYSGDKYNRFRKVLMQIYHELFEAKVVDMNYPLALRKVKGLTVKVREEITPAQRHKIDTYLKEKYHAMWLYMHCFYHSGARSTEMHALKVGDVNFDKQEIKFLVKKGKQYREVMRVMPDVAVKYWREVIGDAPKDYYVFAKGRKPGEKPVKAYQITKSWNRHIKTKLKVDFGFYGLKHDKLTGLSDELGQQAAADMGQESVKMIEQHYDLKSRSRKNESLKKAGKEFN